MKTLILIRHAKSSWNEYGKSDFERSLNKRGKHDAPEMGRRLAERLAESEKRLDAFICSSACRARQTAQLLVPELAFPARSIDWRDELYLASSRTMLNVIRKLPDEVNTAALLAHNPGITELVEYLTCQYFENVPTCGVALLNLKQVNWHTLEAACTDLVDFDYPKRLQ